MFVKPIASIKPFVSVILNSPPSLCSITTLFCESTLATMFVNPAPLIPPAITSASAALLFVVTVTVIPLFNASCPTIDSAIVNDLLPAP